MGHLGIGGDPAGVVMRPIGVVVNGISRREQVDEWNAVCSDVVLDDALAESAVGLEEYSHAYVLYVFDRVPPSDRRVGKVAPYGLTDVDPKGVLATRMRQRPNPLALTLVAVRARHGSILTVQGLDAFHGSPVLDLKPFMGDQRDVPAHHAIPAWAQRVQGRR